MARWGSGWLAWAFASASLCVGAVRAQSSEDVFKQAFGNRTARPQQLDAELEIDGYPRDSVAVTIQGRTLLQVDPVQLAERLQDLLDQATATCLGAVSAGTESVQGAADCGVGLSYDPAALQLRAEVAPDHRVEQSVSVRPQRPSLTPTTTPAELSAYLNVAGSARRLDSARSIELRAALALDGALRWRSTTFEFDGFCASGGCVPGLRSLVRDQPEALRRWRIGDLPGARADGLGLPGLRGVSVGTEFELSPALAYTAELDAPLELASPTTLEVLVNGRVVQRVQLPAGRYSIRDFPLASGSNSAELRLTDAAGRQESRALEAFVDLALLDAGRYRYGLAIGRPQLPLTEAGVELSPLLFAGEYALGIGPRTTLTAGAAWIDRVDHGAATLGLTQAVGDWLLAGRFACSVGLSAGCRSELRFRRAAVAGPEHWQYEGAVDWREAKFADVLGAASPFDQGQLLLRASRSVFDGYGLALGLRANWNREQGSAGSLSALVGGRLARQLGFRVGVERGFGSDSTAETRVFLSFNVLFDHARQSVQWDIESPDALQSTRWQLNRANLSGGFNAALAAARSTRSDRQEGSASYRHERFSSDLSFSRSVDEGPATSESRLSMRSALVYADQQFGMTERVIGGFAIVQPMDPVAAGTVYVNPVEADYLASSRGPGPAVVTGLRPYEARSLVLVLPELAADHDAGELFPVVQPGYKGGVLIPSGGTTQVRLQARILGSDGAPVTMISGQLEAAGKSPIPVFAGRNGVLRASGLTVGDWLLVLQTQPVRRHRIKVDAATRGVLDVGDLRP